MVETVFFQLLLEYDLESDNVSIMHGEIVDFEKEIENKKKERRFESQSKRREAKEDDGFLFSRNEAEIG